jgi:hypothetical protein
VTYKQKFTASERKAHNRNIATKIHKEMSELRGRVRRLRYRMTLDEFLTGLEFLHRPSTPSMKQRARTTTSVLLTKAADRAVGLTV